jgi:hypothetical protein
MNVSEEATSVCSRDICEDERLEESYPDRISSMSEDLGLVWLHVVAPPELETELTSVSENWGNFGGAGDDEDAAPETRGGTRIGRFARRNLNGGRPVRFQEWIDSIEPGTRPQLNFKHTLLPHVPWQYLPSGDRYRRQPNDAIDGLSTQAFEDQGQLDVLFQRHALQTLFTDLQLQKLWAKLRAEGMWDDSLIVVAADHGVAFPLGSVQRRRLNRDTAAEIAPIPLFIKAPGQKEPKVDDAYVETIDILPTMFDILNLDPRVDMDGKSAYSDEVQSRDELRFLIRNTFDTLRIPADEFEADQRDVLARNDRLIGRGSDGSERMYRLGPHQELIGKPASAAGPPLDVEFAYAGDYANVDPASGLVPTHVVASVNGPDRHPRDIAVAVNGRIAGVGNTFELAIGDEGELVSVMVPESAFRRGRNQVEVLSVE